MRRKRLVVLLVLMGIGALFVVFWWWPSPPPPAPPPPPVVKRRELPLQADAEGYYVPGYRFTVNRFEFRGLSLRPDALVTFATSGGAEQAVPCLEARVSPDAVRLRCDDPQVGTVSVDGRFLTRFATDRLDTVVLSAVITVRSGSGEILYSARDSFRWHPAD
jgi:hypothetical protein